MKEVFGGHHPLAVTPANVLGILSLVFWALTITVSLKYVCSSPVPTTRARAASWP
jgi:KUP system potassium uptake protein